MYVAVMYALSVSVNYLGALVDDGSDYEWNDRQTSSR